MNNKELKKLLDGLYFKYKKKHSSADPVWFLHGLKDEKDIELLGLIASSYSYGNVTQINKFISSFLSLAGSRVYEFTCNYSEQKDKKFLKKLFYRFNPASDLSVLLIKLKTILGKHQSLLKLFSSGYVKEHANIIPALKKFTAEFKSGIKKDSSFHYLIPSPENKSACKRLNLFLRWMVRKDEIDLGIWSEVADKSKLIMPVDTHVYRISRELNLVNRKSCDLKFAEELTECLKKFDKSDPVKYDFALCHYRMEKHI